MFDAPVRRRLDPALSTVAGWVDRPGVTPDRITAVGLALGLGSAGAAAATWWWVSLALWLLSRLADGVDGPLARRRGGQDLQGDHPSGAGGFFDITADFVVYGSTVLGVAVGASAEFGASVLPFAAVLLAYYVNGSAFLAFSSIAERTGRRLDDGRSLSFLAGLAEGTETVLVHSLWLIVPAAAPVIAWGWAGVVGVSAGLRIVDGYRRLR